VTASESPTAAGSFQVRQATVDDVDAVAELFTDAFAEDPLVRWMARDLDRATVVAWYRGIVGLSVELGETWTAHDHSAAATWFVARDTPGPSEAYERWIVPLEAHPVLGPRMARLDAATMSIRPEERLDYLGVLGTRATRRGHGLARAVMNPVRRRADAEERPLYLETTKVANLGFYRWLGFRETARARVADDAPELIGMWRDPGAGAAAWPD
jgi:GNAT superfamily N-acetyltransferase